VLQAKGRDEKGDAFSGILPFSENTLANGCKDD
jgi:hypothetical protein